MLTAQDKRLDNLWAQLVKQRDHNVCRICGRNDELHAHHIFGRTGLSTRWDIDNGITLCVHHHLEFAHKHKEDFENWLLNNIFTIGQFDALRALSSKPVTNRTRFRELTEEALHQIEHELSLDLPTKTS